MFSGTAGLWAGDVVSFHVPTFHLFFQISVVCGIICTETYTNAGCLFITIALLHLHFMYIYSRPPDYFSLIFKALRDYSITLLLDCKTELELKVLINRGLLYVELNDYSSALQVGQSYKEKKALIASGLWIMCEGFLISVFLFKAKWNTICNIFLYL